MDRRKKKSPFCVHFTFSSYLSVIDNNSSFYHRNFTNYYIPPPPYISEYNYVRKKEACFKKNVNILIDGSIIFDLIDTR